MTIALPFDLSDIVDAAVKDATGAGGVAVAGTHLELAVGAARVRLICVPTPRPRSAAGIVEELGELIGRAAADPFTVGAVATYGAVFVVIPSKIALRFAERDPDRRPS